MPQQNGLAESKHRHIVTMIRTLLATSNVPHRFWVEAALTAVSAPTATVELDIFPQGGLSAQLPAITTTTQASPVAPAGLPPPLISLPSSPGPQPPSAGPLPSSADPQPSSSGPHVTFGPSPTPDPNPSPGPSLSHVQPAASVQFTGPSSSTFAHAALPSPAAAQPSHPMTTRLRAGIL
ncbi:PREDICTED: vegetative cell wall protein gp1-like [Prunus mume]|uniref:Vegetative cell wall protein gp1-like n=1 Tax=Prunus mume TaxID=102107 RepID=A0ABM0PK66_PRUMU|nr:PREDICTED: vegetative cell wall protein gp1-like [Prunus mume]